MQQHISNNQSDPPSISGEERMANSEQRGFLANGEWRIANSVVYGE
jgi:hypothetical protein